MRKRPQSALSMIEMMVTTVIIGTCLVLALRAFSVCAATISYANNSMIAVDILQEKLAALKEKSVLAGGVTASSATEDIVVDNRTFVYTQTITRWQEPTEESEPQQPHTQEKGSLCEAALEMRWKSAQKEGKVFAKTYMPLKESGDTR